MHGYFYVNQHVTNVIASSAQTFHALRVFRVHGLNKDAVDGVFKAVVIARLTYACPACRGFITAHNWQRMESIICQGMRFGFCSTNQAPLAELATTADETLFENILHNKQHVYSIYCCRTERSQPTTFAQENMTVHLCLNSISSSLLKTCIKPGFRPGFEQVLSWF